MTTNNEYFTTLHGEVIRARPVEDLRIETVWRFLRKPQYSVVLEFDDGTKYTWDSTTASCARAELSHIADQLFANV